MAGAGKGTEAGAPIGVATVFLSNTAGPDGDAERTSVRHLLEAACSDEQLAVIDWRCVPVEPGALGDFARASAPRIEQAILSAEPARTAADAEARCYRARKRAERAIADAGLRGYLASMSFSTVTYKAMCAADQLASFYPDLRDPGFTAPFVIFHQRYSTNTTPSWERAQPFRLLGHNGEINTIQGNVNRMRAREGRLGADRPVDEDLLRPVIDEEGSDSAMLDNALELLVRGGRDIRHALAMLIPEAWEGFDVDPAVRDFYRYHACLMEPWDGPAGLVFTDGVRVGASLNDQSQSMSVGGPGEDAGPADLVARQAAFGYTKEEFTYVLRPMATQGHEPVFSMGDDTAPSVLAHQPRLLYSYVKQRFAQVTNPPIDHLRERLVMSLRTTLGPPAPLLRDGPEAGRVLQLDSFLLFPSGLSGIRSLPVPFMTVDLDATFAVGDGAAGLERSCRRLARDAESAIDAGAAILIISDSAADHDRAPVPALLAVGSVHHHLMRAGLRSRTSLIVETDEARDVHHVVALLGYGAQAICPRLALQSIAALPPPATEG